MHAVTSICEPNDDHPSFFFDNINNALNDLPTDDIIIVEDINCVPDQNRVQITSGKTIPAQRIVLIKLDNTII